MEELIKKAKKGDKESFIQAINLISVQLYKTGKSMNLSDEDIGDAMQDSILTAYEKLGELRVEKFFKTWIVRIFINNCKSILNKNNKVLLIEDFTEMDRGVKEDCYDELESAIESLKEDYKVVIKLYYMGGYSIGEMADILNEKEGTLKSKLSRARNELRKIYKVNMEVV